MKKFIIFSIPFAFLLTQCAKEDSLEERSEVEIHTPVKAMTIALEDANRLVALPFNCMQVEYPNKLNQTIGGGEDLQSAKDLHPAFYGCFDWHWSLVSLLKQFPELENRELIKAQLAENISEENIINELTYFKDTHSKYFEHTFGWSWLLKLAEELHTWDDPLARQLKQNLRPLTDHVVNGYLGFLSKLNYPIRVGEHTNSAFGLTFAYDYGIAVQDSTLTNLITSDRTDGKLVHLDGVNFSRVWCLLGIANQVPEHAHLKKVANIHVSHSLLGIVDDNYEGIHRLGSFAIYALNTSLYV